MIWSEPSTVRSFIIPEIQWSDPSEIRSFIIPSETSEFILQIQKLTNNNTIGNVLFQFIPQALDQPQKIEPINNLTNVLQPRLFRWGAVAGATHYRIQISKNIEFTQIEFEDVVTSTEILISGLDNLTKHYWRVRAILMI